MRKLQTSGRRCCRVRGSKFLADAHVADTERKQLLTDVLLEVLHGKGGDKGRSAKHPSQVCEREGDRQGGESREGLCVFPHQLSRSADSILDSEAARRGLGAVRLEHQEHLLLARLLEPQAMRQQRSIRRKRLVDCVNVRPGQR